MGKTEEFQSAFSDCVLKIIASNILFRNELEDTDMRSGMSSLEALATIQISANRRIGHTTALFEASRAFFKKPLFIFPSSSQREFFIREKGVSSSFCHVSSDLKGSAGYALRSRDAILVDNASYIRGEDMENIKRISQDMYNVNKNFCFILIG
jgi:hypothetical protein